LPRVYSSLRTILGTGTYPKNRQKEEEKGKIIGKWATPILNYYALLKLKENSIFP